MLTEACVFIAFYAWVMWFIGYVIALWTANFDFNRAKEEWDAAHARGDWDARREAMEKEYCAHKETLRAHVWFLG